MLTLVIGDKELSSWSLRPWLVLKHFDLPFREMKLKLDTPQFASEVARYTDAAKVPVLLDGELRVWDSLAIVEYVNEKVGGRGWPKDAATRAVARAVSAEMHSGFAALRTTWPMHSTGVNPNVPLTPEARKDVARVESLWQDCRSRYGGTGPWLFGEFSIADAMYAPVVLRFNHYGAKLGAVAQAYVRQWLDNPHMREWIRGAQEELTQGF